MMPLSDCRDGLFTRHEGLTLRLCTPMLTARSGHTSVRSRAGSLEAIAAMLGHRSLDMAVRQDRQPHRRR
jgi:hypothetical protein